MKKIRQRVLQCSAALLLLYIVLLIPDKEEQRIKKVVNSSFRWNKDALWQQLENDFKLAKQQPPSMLDTAIQAAFNKAEIVFKAIDLPELTATDNRLDTVLQHFFSMASLVAAQPAYTDSFLQYYVRLRNTVKTKSREWDMQDIAVRNRMYSMLYGARAAVEEVLLQQDTASFKPALFCKKEQSVTPAASILGITVHSGDLLVSRGGAAVSAFIARANDYPANFSHVALVYVDDKTGQAQVIESHIEKGVAVSTIQEYEADKKLRFMVLRPRAHLPALQQNPLLPHIAAKFAYDEALKRHIPYDFKMNFYDSSAMFCSEVGSYAYRKNGLQLWQAVSTISSQGMVNWLHAFGVENFVTQMPGDLEYDPQLSVVAEWRDPQALYKDHIDNAVTDALLEQADKGKAIEYNRWMLPVVRMIKGWCILKNLFGGVGIIPEGMSATQALKNQSFTAMFNALQTCTTIAANRFITTNGYKPPYWQLAALAGKCAVGQ
ncbi:MAG TPA: YiiX/YebB-like N1pC/P60 family cysteine hydrolase [Ferruginibacter sp.]|mgnify:CR=1 FL=1|nr:YiiX/YebB-like N1pC/P60 family cysteine hydrolase [Ferruginibacter sp.]HMP21601.1 YiiX/YebB-like N1pC/P60 family cysteine hydrolase [Ferruginibacter sp.]